MGRLGCGGPHTTVIRQISFASPPPGKRDFHPWGQYQSPWRTQGLRADTRHWSGGWQCLPGPGSWISACPSHLPPAALSEGTCDLMSSPPRHSHLKRRVCSFSPPLPLGQSIWEQPPVCLMPILPNLCAQTPRGLGTTEGTTLCKTGHRLLRNLAILHGGPALVLSPVPADTVQNRAAEPFSLLGAF